MADDHGVTITIRGRNLSGPEFEAAKRQLSGLKDDGDKATKSGDGIGSPFKVSFSAIAMGATAAIGAITAIGAAAVALGQRGADVSDIKGHFDQLNTSIGNNATSLVGKLRDATKGTISDFDLMKASNVGLSQGLRLNEEQFGLTGRAARVLADRVGGDTKTAYEGLIRAMTTGQDKQLKQIGLDIDATAAVEQHAASLGKQAGKLTESEKETAVRNAVLEQMRRVLKESGDAEVDFGDRISQVTTFIKNQTDELARGVAESPVLGAAMEGVGQAIAAAFGGDTQGLVKAVVRIIEDAAFVGINLGIAFAELQNRIGGFAIAVADLASDLPGVGNHFKEQAVSLRATTASWSAMRDGLVSTKQKMIEARQEQDAGKVATDRATTSIRASVGAQNDAAASTDAQRAALVKARQEWDAYKAGFDGRKLAEEADKIVRVVNELGGAHAFTTEEQKKMQAPLTALIEKYKVLGREAPADVVRIEQELRVLSQDLLKSTLDVGKLWAAFKEPIRLPLDNAFDAGAFLTPLKAAVTAQGPTIGRDLGGEISKGMEGVVGNIANTLSQGFTGGGGLMGAFKAIGVQLANAVTAPIMASLGKLQTASVGIGSSLSGALGNAAGGGTVGTIASIASGLGGAAIAATGWGASMAAAGVAGTVALSAATLGIGAAAIGVAMLIKKFTGIPKEVKEARKEVDQFQEAIANTLTPTQQAEAGGEKWKMTVIGVRDAYLATGHTAAEAEAIVKQLWDTDRPQRAREAMVAINDVMAEHGRIVAENTRLQGELNGAQDELTRLTKESDITIQGMRDTAQKYGVDLGSLGPKFQSGRLHESAQTIWDDFVMLTRGGASVGGVLLGMKDEILNLATESVRFGVQIPANFRPLIDNLAQSQELTEEERLKLKALGDENFGDPIVAKLDAIATRMGELIDKIGDLSDQLARNVPSAADRAADGISRAMRGTAIPALDDTYDALMGVIEGHSPGLQDLGDIARQQAMQLEAAMRDHAIHGLDETYAVVRRLQEGMRVGFEDMGDSVSKGLDGPLAAAQGRLSALLNGMGSVDAERFVGDKLKTEAALASGDWLSSEQAIARAQAAAGRHGSVLSAADLAAMGDTYGQRDGLFQTSAVDAFLAKLEARILNYDTGTGGTFPDFGAGRLARLHAREAVTPFEQRVPTAQRWLAESGGASLVTVQLYVGLDPQSGRIRQLTQADRAQVQQWLNEATLHVPARTITGRPA